ncbi:MAG: exo-alpha-sialidase [Alphaproteobacteria bacterium]|nr:exo-alpha-sialidase [Alphaproteobacteria bacterium]
MSDRILLATRKGFFDVRRVCGRWRIAATAFLGDQISMVLRDPRDGTVYAAQALGHFGVKLQRSETEGRTWHEVPAPAFPRAADAEKGPSVDYILALEPGGAAAPGRLWCGTIPGGLFRSDDRGASWRLDEALWNAPGRAEWRGGGFDKPGIDSICVDPRDPRHVTLAVSTGGVWQTADGGGSWRPTSEGMFAVYMPPERRKDPLVQDVHRLVQCAAAPEGLWAQHHNGVFRSTNGGRRWREVKAIRPSKFGFAVQVHPGDPDTAWFVPGVKDECRIPVDAKLVVARTRDGGASFEVLTRGLPQKDAYDLVHRHGLAVDATGTRLAMGSTTGHLWVSENAGSLWTLVSGNLPPIACVRFA